MLKRIIFILLVVLLAGCSKSVVEPGCGGYSFGKIYLYMNGGMVDMNELTIAVPPEEGYTDIEVVTGRLLKFDYLEGDDKNISLEFPGPFEANPEDPWMTHVRPYVLNAAPIRALSRARANTASMPTWRMVSWPM